MTDRIKSERKGRKRIRVEKLELNKETVENLTGEEAEAAQGGMPGSGACASPVLCAGTSGCGGTIRCCRLA